MRQLLETVWSLILGLLSNIQDLAVVCIVFVYDILYHLHTSAPRLEGLLVGVALAWLLLRREKHPVLRILSSPLKLILDILDLAWDQVVEVVSDGVSVLKGWVLGSLSWVRDRVLSVWGRSLDWLKDLKSKLSKK